MITKKIVAVDPTYSLKELMEKYNDGIESEEHINKAYTYGLPVRQHGNNYKFRMKCQKREHYAEMLMS